MMGEGKRVLVRKGREKGKVMRWGLVMGFGEGGV